MLRLLTLSLLLVWPLVASAEDWPGWRGPRGDGTSLEKGIPLHFSPTQNVHWKTAIPGRGYSSPAIVGNCLFLTSCLESKNKADNCPRLLLCLDRQSGKLLWQREVLAAPLERKHSLNSYASSTPAADAESVYVSFMGAGNTMQVACYDHKGNKRWHVSPGKLLSVHGFCSSPVLHRDLVILNGDQDAQGYLVALNRKTGQEVWRTDRPNRTRSYCVPLLIDCPKRKGVKQLVLSGSKCVTGYDADTGKLLWIHDGPTEQYVASLVLHQGVLFLTTGYPEYHLMGIRPDGEGNITRTDKVLWHIPHKDNGARGAAYVPSPLAHDGHFFVISDTGFLGCIEAQTGKRLWQKKLGRRHSASPILVEGHLIIPDDDGKVWIVPARPHFEVLACNDLAEEIYASPATSQGQLFLRTIGHLYCIGKPTASR